MTLATCCIVYIWCICCAIILAFVLSYDLLELDVDRAFAESHGGVPRASLPPRGRVRAVGVVASGRPPFAEGLPLGLY